MPAGSGPLAPRDGRAVSALPPIGAVSAQRLAAVRSALDRVAAQGLPETEALVRAARRRIEGAAAVISVVGQVKAGKSSLINALTGIGGLLPTEVNPWTAVITNLHFGHAGHAEGSAVFRFFTREEWDRMLEGGSESRRMAEEYLPGFRSEVLTGQIREMQDRAKTRLGDLFHLLLGKEHRFDRVTPDILQRYVSAGYGGSDGADPTAGRFSTITRSAEVYLPAGPFLVPTTVSDTPGINDPFLVRDEITTSSFRNADVFVVTLSAHQTLNPADVALLRMLAHVGGRRIVLFVNRIDELDDPGSDVPALLRSLEAKLAREFGDMAPEIVAGSARWGERALADAGTAAAAAADPACLGYLRGAGLPEGLPPEKALLAASGLPRLAAVLGEMIHAARVGPVLSDAVAQTVQGIGFLAAALEDRLAREAAETGEPDDLRAIAEQEMRAIETRLTDLSALDRDLARLTEEGREQLRLACARMTDAAMHAIREAVDRFVEEQLVAFRAALAADGAAAAWRFDTEAVQQRAQRHVVDSYQSGRAEFDEVLRAYAGKLDVALEPVAGPLPVGQLLEGLPNFRILPGLRARSNLVEVELTRDRGWQFWRSRTLGEDEAVARIARVIRAELNPDLQDLQRAISRALAGRSAAAMDRLAGLLGRARDLILNERNELRSDAYALMGDLDAAAIDRLRGRRARRTEGLRAKIEALVAARRMLEAQTREPPPTEPADFSLALRRRVGLRG